MCTYAGRLYPELMGPESHGRGKTTSAAPSVQILTETMASRIVRTAFYLPSRASRTLPIQTRANIIFRGRFMSSEATSQYENILVSRPEPNILLVTLNRPKALNALNSALFKELNKALLEADRDDGISAMILTGSEKAFAGSSFRVICTWFMRG